VEKISGFEDKYLRVIGIDVVDELSYELV